MTNEIILKRSTGSNPDFIENCALKEIDLEKRLSKEKSDIKPDELTINKNYEDIKHVVIAYIGDTAAGSGAIMKYEYDDVPDATELKRLFVKNEFQGNGIGTKITNELILWAKELGFKNIILETADFLKEACHIYYKLGFEKIDNYTPYINEKESLCMKKTL